MVRNIPGSFVPRDNSQRDQWSNYDRYMNDSPISPNHFPALSSTRSSETAETPAIETALRERCGIHIKHFAMIATLADGHTATFTSEKLMAQERYLFNEEFQRAYFRQIGISFVPQPTYNDFNKNAPMRRQSSSTDSSTGNRRQRNRSQQQQFMKEESDDDDDDYDDDSFGTVKKGRKRLRGSQENDDDDAPPMQSSRTRNLRIGDTEEVTRFLEGRFRDMQQAACKIIAKAFVKVVEPRKQTNFPYTGGAERAPMWWPRMPVEGQPGGVKHKEPDHLLKPERITLLVHILRLGHMKEFGKEHVTIKELQIKTKEAMLTWFNDKAENGAKSKFLDEIFKVARAEERYRNGEIDGSFVVPVMHGTDPGIADPEDEAEDAVNEEEEDAFSSTMSPQSQPICTPDSSMVSPISSHSHSSLTRPMSGNSVSGFGYREMPVRQYSNQTPTNANLLQRPEDPQTYENDSLTNMGVQSFLPSRPMGYIQPQQHHQPQNHGLPDHARRTSCHPSNSFGTNSSNVFTNWSNNSMIPSYNNYPPPAPTPLASNGPLLPLPNSSSTSLLPPMNSQNSQQQNSGFNDSTMFRDQQTVTGQQHHSLRTGSLSNPHQQYHHTQQQPTYDMSGYMQDYNAHTDAVMKDENIGGGT